MANEIVQRVNLRSLEPDIPNALIIGIIIGTQRPRKFPDSRIGYGDNRAVWNFTLRDSPQDYINVTYWGNASAVLEAYDIFHTGDVVEITRPIIFIRKVNDFGEQFRPMVTSPYSLSLNEKSKITKHEGSNVTAFFSLLALPTKPLAGFIPLDNIQNIGETLGSDTRIDVLVAISTLNMIRTVKTKNNGEIQVREVILFDHTFQGIKLTIWDTEVIARSMLWQPRSTILFLTDVKVDFSQFHRTYVLSTTNRTIVTENPIGREAQDLKKYIQTAPVDASFEQQSISIPDLSSIQNVLRIEQVHDKLNAMMENPQSAERHFTALLFAVVTQLDLDGNSRITSIRCGHCKALLKFSSSTCENVDCPVARGAESFEPQIIFDLRIMISDYSGSLVNCRVNNAVAESMLGCTAQQFVNMTDDEKCMLKWKYLMECCSICILATINKSNPFVSILSCEIADKQEFVRRVSIY